MHVNRIVQDGTVQHLRDRVTTLSSQLALVHSRLEALERRPTMPDSIVKACAELLDELQGCCYSYFTGVFLWEKGEGSHRDRPRFLDLELSSYVVSPK
jgi:hypothetical protein